MELDFFFHKVKKFSWEVPNTVLDLLGATRMSKKRDFQLQEAYSLEGRKSYIFSLQKC